MMMAALDGPTFLFGLFALLTCGFAVAVLFTSNIVRMAFFLTLSLGGCAGLFFLAGAQFVGAMQLMIYVGGTMVLLVFGVMLTAQAPFVSLRTPSGEWVLGLLVGTALLAVVGTTAFRVESWRTPRTAGQPPVPELQTASAIGAGLLGVRVDRLQESDPVRRGGMSGYLLPFVIISVHLLVVLVGAAYMARSRSARRPAASRSQRRGN